jgi:multidrug efflux system membrane fusion protein
MARKRVPMMLCAACAAGVAATFYFGLLPLDRLRIDLGAIQTRVMAAVPPPTSTPVQRRNIDVPVRVSVALVKAEDVPLHLSGIGTVQAYNTVAVKTRVDGEIVKILFEEGQDVNAGEPLAVIDPRPFEAQLKQEEATRLINLAELEGAELDLKRYEALIQKSYSTQQQLDRQRAQVEQIRARIQKNDAEIEYAKVQLDYTTIRAPISGRTGIRQVDRGNIVRAQDNTTIVVLTQLQPISVIFTLAATSVAQARLTLGRTHVPVVALGADNTTLLDRGNIDLVDNLVDQTTGMVKLRASFPNAKLALWPGNFVNGRLVIGVRRQGPTVPSAAVRHGPRGDFVWVMRSDKTVESRDVSVGQAFNGRTLVRSGLSQGELVVTDGHFLLENGSRVETVEPQSGPPASPQASPRRPVGQDEVGPG